MVIVLNIYCECVCVCVCVGVRSSKKNCFQSNLIIFLQNSEYNFIFSFFLAMCFTCWIKIFLSLKSTYFSGAKIRFWMLSHVSSITVSTDSSVVLQPQSTSQFCYLAIRWPIFRQETQLNLTDNQTQEHRMQGSSEKVKIQNTYLLHYRQLSFCFLNSLSIRVVPNIDPEVLLPERALSLHWACSGTDYRCLTWKWDQMSPHSLRLYRKIYWRLECPFNWRGTDLTEEHL